MNSINNTSAFYKVGMGGIGKTQSINHCVDTRILKTDLHTKQSGKIVIEEMQVLSHEDEGLYEYLIWLVQQGNNKS